MDAKHFVKGHSSQTIPLNFEEGYELGLCAIEGCNGNSLSQIQSLALLTALHNKAVYQWKKGDKLKNENDHQLPDTAADQIAGICSAIFENDIAKSEYGFLNPNVSFAIDNCGMGGDLTITANVSTIAAFIAATAGIPMCKHGSPANADKGQHGSSDFISLLGISTYADKKAIEACVEKEYFGYTEALDTRYKQIHLQTHRFAFMPHMNDIIGPITNPLNPHVLTRRVLGVNHLIPPHVVAMAYKIMNERGVTDLKHGLFVRGFTNSARSSGVDEVSICAGGTEVCEFIDGEIRNYNLFAEDFGITSIPQEMISPPIGMSKGEFSLRILKGEEKGPVVKMILANAALLFYLANDKLSLKNCYKRAEEVYFSGTVCQKVLAIQNRLPK